MSEIEDARIDLHHLSEQVAHANYALEQAQKALDKAKSEWIALSQKQWEAGRKLTSLRMENKEL